MEQGRLDKMEEMLSTLILMVGNIKEEQTQTNERLDRIESRLDRIESRLDSVESRLDSVENRLDRVENRLDSLESRFDKMDGRLDNIEKEQISMRTEIMTKLSEMEADQDHLWQKTIKNERDIVKVKVHL